MIRVLRVGCVVALLLAAVVSRADVLRVGLGDLDYPPFYFTKQGELQGAAIEVAEALAGQLGHQLNYERLPFVRVQRHLASGDLDMVVLYFRTPEREESALYLQQPHLQESSFMVVKKGLQGIPAGYRGSFLEWRDQRFLSVRGYYHGETFRQALFLDKQLVINEQELIRRILSAGRFVGVGNRAALQYHAERMGVADQLQYIEPAIDRGDDYIAFSRKIPKAEQYVAEFSEALRRFKRSRRYAEIIRRYGLDH